MLKTLAAFALGVVLAPKVHDALNLVVPPLCRQLGRSIERQLFPDFVRPTHTYARYSKPQEESSSCSSS